MEATLTTGEVVPDAVFETATLGPLALRNRLVFAATSSELADEDGDVTDDMIEYYAVRARDVGLVVVEATYVSREGKRLSHNAMIDDDARIPGLARLADALHAEGAAAILQLNHGGRESVRAVSGRVVAPSAIASAYTGVGESTVPHALTTEEISRVVEDFVAAAVRAQRAGFDGIELHGAHGYLISQFLSPNANERDDAYGGSIDRRARFYVELVERIRAATGSDFVIVCRINARDGDGIERGLELDDAVRVAQALELAGADSISVTAGLHASRPYLPIAGMALPRGLFLPYAESFRSALRIPVMIVGRLKTAESLAAAAAVADFVCISRALIADPEFPSKIREGRASEVVPCIACNECLTSVHRHRGIVCTMNPAASREREFADALASIPRRQRVAVVGGGVAGLACAVAAARRGHHVVVFERADRIGGQLNLAHVPPNRAELRAALEHFEREVRRWGVEVRVGSDAGVEELAAMKPDRVVVAVGAAPRPAGIPGEESHHVVRGQDVLSGDAHAAGRVVIIGGGLVGIEVADHLAEDGHDVTLVARSGILKKAVHADRVYFTERISALGVDVRVGRVPERIEARRVVLRDGEGSLETIEGIDSVVLCVGYDAQPAFADRYASLGVPVTVIGDAVASRKLFEAIEEGTLSGIRI